MQIEDNLAYYDVDDAMKPLVRRLAVGESSELEQQLIKKSHESNILKFTPKDATNRFGTAEMLAAWKVKGREIHWLLGEGDDLAGVMWYGPRKFPLDITLPEMPTFTLGLRIYDGYTGHGLARPFMLLSLRVLVERQKAQGEAPQGFWIQTDTDNAAALATYAKFGYQEVDRTDKRVTLILTTERIRQIIEG